jgi:hypothetical protein
MSWKDNFKKTFDRAYGIVKRTYPYITCPCYGGRYYWNFIVNDFENLYFYLTQNSLIYYSERGYVTEIPFNEIKDLRVKQGKVFKHTYTIRFVADKKYHLQLNVIKDFSTELTGDSADNTKNFISTLQASVAKYN